MRLEGERRTETKRSAGEEERRKRVEREKDRDRIASESGINRDIQKERGKRTRRRRKREECKEEETGRGGAKREGAKLLRVSCACSTLPSRPLPPPPRPAHLKTSYPAIKTPRKLYASRPRAPASSKRTTWLSY